MEKNVILCVDDEKMILDSLKTQLKEHYGNSFSYETAENVNEALEVIDELMEEEVKIVIIVSDWLMPVLKVTNFLLRYIKNFPVLLKLCSQDKPIR